MHDYAHGKINLSSAGELQIDLKTFIGRCIYFVISMYIFFILRHETFAQWTFAIFNADAEIYCCFRLDARISNILIFMCHFSHQTNKRFYLHSIIVNVVPVKADRKPKTDMHVVRGHLKSTFVEVRGEGGGVRWKANKNEQGEGAPNICVRSLF